jgi:hypothetical protein
MIEKSERDQDPSVDSWIPIATSRAKPDPEPGDSKTEQGGESGMTGGGDGGDEKGFRAAPALHTSGENKRQPMSRDRRMEKGDSESCNGDGRENRFVHLSLPLPFSLNHSVR